MHVRKYSFFSLIFITLLLTQQPSFAARTKDPRFVPIAVKEVQRFSSNLPLGSSQHGIVISRAYNSGIPDVAYRFYTRRWQKQPDNARTNYYRGAAAHSYYKYAASHKIVKTGKMPLPKGIDLLSVANESLQRAIEISPRYATAHAFYGRILYEGDKTREEKGLRLIQKALVLDPKSAYVRAVLGSAYARPYGSAYSPQQAEEELKTSMQLDKTSSYPHYVLIRLYREQGRYAEANKELTIYTSLVSDKAARQATAFFKPLIDKGLANSSKKQTS